MFSEPRQREAYKVALSMHDTLSVERSGRGNAYRRGWNGDKWDPTWTSYPIWRAGKQNRKLAGVDAKPLK